MMQTTLAYFIIALVLALIIVSEIDPCFIGCAK